MNSALYFGQVRHRRFTPKPHAFDYRLFMVYLDLAELDRVFRGRWFWSTRRRAVAAFRRADHLGDPAQPLAEAVRDLVAEHTGERPAGRVCLLTHLRYWGYTMNPISVYYCFGADDTAVSHLVLEVNNTPWGERHCYVLTPAHAGGARLEADFEKAFHVSPFLGMDYTYHARLTEPGDSLVVHLENHNAEGCAFDATLSLRHKPINGASLAGALVAYPWMTAKVLVAIYAQALRLWTKGFKYFPHTRSAKGALRTEVPTA